jgi:hypothetical protein
VISDLVRSATVIVPGVPPNWSQFRGSSRRRDIAKAEWRDLTWRLAQSQRNRLHWPMPTAADPLRYLTVQIYKRPPLFDHDGAVSSIKGHVDGIQRVLVWDDSPRYLAFITPPDQLQTVTANNPCVVLTVHLSDPRETA